MAFMSKSPNSAPTAPSGPQQWGQAGVSERFVLQDSSITPSLNTQQMALTSAGIVDELRHVLDISSISSHGGSNSCGQDRFGPYNLVNRVVVSAGSNTPLVSVSGIGLQLFDIIEYPDKSFDANATPVSAMDPYLSSYTGATPTTTPTDWYNFPGTGPQAAYAAITTQPLRYSQRIPVALPLQGTPGGKVGLLTLQNRAITNMVTPTFNLRAPTSSSYLYNLTGSYGSGSTPADAPFTYPYWNDSTSTTNYVEVDTGATMAYQIWKRLYTVPISASLMPLAGFVRYLQEYTYPLSGTQYIYNFPPGGVLLRALFQLIDGTGVTVSGHVASRTPVGGIPNMDSGGTTRNTQGLSNITYQYGANKTMDTWTHQQALHEQMALYGRTLPKGTYCLDYYTDTRSLVNAKSLENVANPQAVLNLNAAPSNTLVTAFVRVITDTVRVVQPVA